LCVRASPADGKSGLECILTAHADTDSRGPGRRHLSGPNSDLWRLHIPSLADSNLRFTA
jgi:hypothetical protein